MGKQFPFLKVMVATSNQHKLQEIRESFGKIYLNHGQIELTSIGRKEDPIEETGCSFYENALIKAKKIFLKYQLPTLADDSGLVVPALNHEPGIFSSRYAGENATDRENNQKLIAELEKKNLISSREKIGIDAFFVTIVALYFDNKIIDEIKFGKGICPGKIIFEAKGQNGFGYDPYFIPINNNPRQLTFAQMTLLEKSRHSHRHQALKNLAELDDHH